MPTAIRSWIGIACGLGAAVCYAGLNLAIRFAEAHMSIWHIIFYRSLFGVVAMALLARISGRDLLGHQRATLCLLGVAGAVGVTALTVALIVLPLFEALVLLYLFPAFSALLSPWLTGDRMSAGQWVLIGGACTGAALVLGSGHHFGGLQWGHLLGLVAAFGLGLAFTLTRRVSSENNPLTPFFYICSAGIIVALGPILLQSGSLGISVDGLVPLIAVALLATTAHLSGNQALSYLPSPQVGVICMAEVPLGAIIGLLIFGELLSPPVLIGGGMIIAAGIGLNVGKAGR